MRKLWIVLLSLLCLTAVCCWLDPTGVVRGWLRGESFCQGRPTSYWSRALRSDDPAKQSEARQQLERGGADAVAVLTEVLADRKATDWQATEARWNAAEMLGRIGPDAQSASTALLVTLEDPDLHVRSVAATSLPLIDAPAQEAVPALLQLLRGDTSESAIRALSKYGPDARPAMDDLIGLLADQSLATELRWNAARTLGKMQERGAEAVPVISQYLQDAAPTVREHCAEALGDIGPAARNSVPALVAVLNDPATRVRRDAVRSLGQIGAAAADVLPAIEPLLNDPESIVREAARTTWKSVAPHVPLPVTDAQATSQPKG